MAATGCCWRRGGLLLLLLLSTCAALVPGVDAARSQRSPGTEISTSVIITGFYDFVPAYNGLSSCEVAVKNSGGLNAGKINFVVTINAAGEMDKLHRYFFKDQGGGFVAADAGSIGQLREGLQKCFKAAIDAGFSTIHILPHVDPHERDVYGRGLWRNVVKFDPSAKIGPDAASSFSYEDVLLTPIAEALNAVVLPETNVEFTLSAEQGRSVWYFPHAYLQLLQRTKATTTRNKDPSKYTFGVSFNYDKVCGCVEPEEKDPIIYNSTYIKRFDRFRASGGLAKIDVAAVKELLAASDFIGISAYAPLPRQLTAAAMEIPAQTVAFELAAFGIDLKSYLSDSKKQLVYSEQGLGGCAENGKPATSLSFLRVHPFWGAWPNGGYDGGNDPWQVPEFRDYRRTLYRLLADWAAAGGSSSSGGYRIDGVFLWSVGTWDPVGVAPLAPWTGGSYADPVITNYIRQGNAVANRLQVPVPAAQATSANSTKSRVAEERAPTKHP